MAYRTCKALSGLTMLMASALAMAPVAFAQEAAVAAVTVAADHASPDAVVAALYEVISGPAGKARDWPRLRALFAPQAKMIAVGNRPDGSMPAAVMTLDDYIARVTKPFNDAGPEVLDQDVGIAQQFPQRCQILLVLQVD